MDECGIIYEGLSLQNKERADQSVIEGQSGWWGLW